MNGTDGAVPLALACVLLLTDWLDINLDVHAKVRATSFNGIAQVAEFQGMVFARITRDDKPAPAAHEFVDS